MTQSRGIQRHYMKFSIAGALLFLMVLLIHMPSWASNGYRINCVDATMVKGQKLGLYLQYNEYDEETEETKIYIAQNVSWTSSNAKVASVDSSGTVKAKKSGRVTITGSYDGQPYSCAVRVYTSLSASKRKKIANKEAKKIVRRFTNSSMSPEAKAAVLACYLYVNVSLQEDQSNSSYKKNFGNEAYAALVMHQAACSGYCKAYVLLCKAAGLKCKHVNAGKWTHQWNKVKLGGTWVKVDTQVGIFDFGLTEEQLGYYANLAYDIDHTMVIYRKIKNGKIV